MPNIFALCIIWRPLEMRRGRESGGGFKQVRRLCEQARSAPENEAQRVAEYLRHWHQWVVARLGVRIATYTSPWEVRMPAGMTAAKWAEGAAMLAPSAAGHAVNNRALVNVVDEPFMPNR